MKTVRVNLGKVSITVNGIWEDKDYDKLSLVYSPLNNASYISKRPVQKGVLVTDERFWTPIIQGDPRGLEGIYTKEEIDKLLSESLKLIEQEYIKKSNLKTINGESLIGTGNIDTSSKRIKLELDSNLGPILAYGESTLLKIQVYQGDTNITSLVTEWSISRNTGNASEDNAWNIANKDKIKSAGDYAYIYISFTSSSNDLGSDAISTIFTVTAKINDETITS